VRDDGNQLKGESQSAQSDRPISDRVKQVSEQTTTLVRQELELARAEMRRTRWASAEACSEARHSSGWRRPEGIARRILAPDRPHRRRSVDGIEEDRVRARRFDDHAGSILG
jgi:hypothetical protein